MPARDKAATASKLASTPYTRRSGRRSLTIEMAAGQHGRKLRPLTGITKKEVANRVLGHFEPHSHAQPNTADEPRDLERNAGRSTARPAPPDLRPIGP